MPSRRPKICVLHCRLRGTVDGVPARVLPEPHEYFGCRRCRNIDWEPGDNPEHAKLHEQNLVQILDLTKSILQTLKPAISADSCKVAREYATQQDWYCEAFVNQQKFSWLWDLDINAGRERQHAGRWDLEPSVRQPSLKKIHEPNDISIELPLQLRKLRRIRLLFEEARVHSAAGPGGETDGREDE